MLRRVSLVTLPALALACASLLPLSAKTHQSSSDRPAHARVAFQHTANQPLRSSVHAHTLPSHPRASRSARSSRLVARHEANLVQRRRGRGAARGRAGASPISRNPGPRQASRADFLEAANLRGAARTGREHASREQHPQPAAFLAPRHSPPPATAASSPESVISIIRPTPDNPQLAPIEQVVAEPLILPTIYDERGRLLMPSALVGSHEILVHQNEMADADGLGRVQDDADLNGMRERGMLVGLPLGDGLRVDERLPANRRLCRPWVAQFLDDMARAHYTHFHTPLQVNSAIRTVSFQLRLQRTNGNAAPAEGDTASPHLTGQAIDIGKRSLSLPEIAWIRGYLLPLIQSGKIDVEEEFQQSCFHISVYRRYAGPGSTPHYTVASRNGPAALAAAFH